MSNKRRIRRPVRELVLTPGVWILEYRHDDGCPAQRTQRLADCTCKPDVALVSPFGKSNGRTN